MLNTWFQLLQKNPQIRKIQTGCFTWDSEIFHLLPVEVGRFFVVFFQSLGMVVYFLYIYIYLLHPRNVGIWSNYSDLTGPGPPQGSWGREIPLFQGNLGCRLVVKMPKVFFVAERLSYILIKLDFWKRQHDFRNVQNVFGWIPQRKTTVTCPLKSMVGRCISYWNSSFLRDILL